VADPVEDRGEPLPVGGGGLVQPHLAGLHRGHPQRGELAGAGVKGREVEQAQVGPAGLVAGDALVVIDAVAAAVQDELAAVHLDRARVVAGVAVDEVDAAVDQPAGEAHLIRVEAVSPVRSPVDGDDGDVAGPPGRLHLADDVIGGRR
jgi:hypothetical protein